MGIKKLFILFILVAISPIVFAETTILDSYTNCVSCSWGAIYEEQSDCFYSAMAVNVSQELQAGDKLIVSFQTKQDGDVDSHVLNVSLFDDNAGEPTGSALYVNITSGVEVSAVEGAWLNHTFDITDTLSSGMYHVTFIDYQQSGVRVWNNRDNTGKYGDPAGTYGHTYTTDCEASWVGNQGADFQFVLYLIRTESNNAPQVDVLTPPDEDHDFVNLTDLVTFNITDDEEDEVDCQLYINGSSVSVNDTVRLNETGTFPIYELTTDGLYQWYVNCNDSDGSTSSATYDYVLDRVNPILSQDIILSNLTSYNIITNQTIEVNGTLFDENPYRLNISILNGTTVLDSVQSDTVVGDYIYDYAYFNVENYTEGYYTVRLTGSDSHTLLYWNPDWSYDILTSSSIMLHLDDDDIYMGLDNYGNAKPTHFSFDKKTDKLSIDLKFSKTVTSMDFIVSASEIKYIPDSDYGSYGHLVINSKYWFDTYPYVATNVNIFDNVATITLEPNSDDIVLESIGGLNIVTLDYNISLTETFEKNATRIWNKDDLELKYYVTNYGNIYTRGDLTMFSPNGTAFVCGVNNTGSWSCS